LHFQCSTHSAPFLPRWKPCTAHYCYHKGLVIKSACASQARQDVFQLQARSSVSTHTKSRVQSIKEHTVCPSFKHSNKLEPLRDASNRQDLSHTHQKDKHKVPPRFPQIQALRTKPEHPTNQPPIPQTNSRKNARPNTNWQPADQRQNRTTPSAAVGLHYYRRNHRLPSRLNPYHAETVPPSTLPQYMHCF
jgi:hypothetical protein